MSFITDQQTLNDLNIFGRAGNEHIFGIFNRCATRGGAVLLEQMFRSPLSDADAINSRSRIFKKFADAELRFPFDAALLEAIENYLSNEDDRTALVNEKDSIETRVKNFIASDPQTLAIEKGISAVAGLLRTIKELLAGGQYFLNQEGREELSAILKHPVFEQIFKRKNFARHDLAELDDIFRFRKLAMVKQILHQVYLVDVFAAVGRTKRELRWGFAEALETGERMLDIHQLIHPLLKKPVANDLIASKHIIFLTGANMAGKSTFMKSLTVALYLAHMGFPVPAKQMRFSVLDGIFSTINLPDDLGNGASHFSAEVQRIKKVASALASGKKLLVVFDELFRGTNVRDAREATVEIVKAFVVRRSSLFVISTHIIEAGEDLRAYNDQISFLYLPTTMDGRQPVYSYQITEGITDDRHGMVIINNEKILEMLENGLNHSGQQ